MARWWTTRAWLGPVTAGCLTTLPQGRPARPVPAAGGGGGEPQAQPLRPWLWAETCSQWAAVSVGRLAVLSGRAPGSW